MAHQIVPLDKKDWKGAVLPIGYTTDTIYEVQLVRRSTGFSISIEQKALDAPITHTPQEYDFPDRLFADYWSAARAWGIVEGQRLLAAIETCPEEWSNRLRVTELWVDQTLQKQGIGHALMQRAKQQARQEKRRAIILETQSCNANAIGFYLHEGFTLIGLDTICYSNRDLTRDQVRLELGWMLEENKE